MKRLRSRNLLWGLAHEMAGVLSSSAHRFPMSCATYPLPGPPRDPKRPPRPRPLSPLEENTGGEGEWVNTKGSNYSVVTFPYCSGTGGGGQPVFPPLQKPTAALPAVPLGLSCWHILATQLGRRAPSTPPPHLQLKAVSQATGDGLQSLRFAPRTGRLRSRHPLRLC